MSHHIDSVSLIRLQSVPGLGARTLHKLLVWARGVSIRLPDLFSFDSQTLAQAADLKPELASAVLATSADEAAATLEKLEAERVQLVTLGDDAYPAQLLARLGDNAPPLLYVRGAAAPLSAPGVAFSGSRRTSEHSIDVARELAAQAAARGLTVISGHAPGADLAAHQGAVEAGGVTILVLPEGILPFRLHAELRANFEQTPDRFVVVSEFPPRMPWSTRNAMIRNNTILGLARVLVVIEAGESGGTLAAGQRALKLGLPCYVLDTPNLPPSASGNRLLLAQGARAIAPDLNGALQLPDLDQPGADASPIPPPHDPPGGQLRLF